MRESAEDRKLDDKCFGKKYYLERSRLGASDTFIAPIMYVTALGVRCGQSIGRQR